MSETSTTRNPSARSPDLLRLYTHNIYARRADWPARRAVLVEGVGRLAPDVVLFQEEVLTNDFDQTAEILGAGWHIIHSRGRSADEGSGIAIASRWPISSAEEIDLTIDGPPVDEFAWAALLATVDHPSGPLVIVNHFPDAASDREYERERQAIIIARRLHEISAERDMPVVLAGDLDAEPDAASVRFFLGRQSLHGMSTAFVRAWDEVHPGQPCWTLDPANTLFAETMTGWPYRQIDHILIRCARDGLASLLVKSCERAFDQPVEGVWASDHYGLVADMVVRDGLHKLPE